MWGHLENREKHNLRLTKLFSDWQRCLAKICFLNKNINICKFLVTVFMCLLTKLKLIMWINIGAMPLEEMTLEAFSILWLRHRYSGEVECQMAQYLNAIWKPYTEKSGICMLLVIVCLLVLGSLKISKITYQSKFIQFIITKSQSEPQNRPIYKHLSTVAI